MFHQTYVICVCLLVGVFCFARLFCSCVSFLFCLVVGLILFRPFVLFWCFVLVLLGFVSLFVCLFVCLLFVGGVGLFV